MVTAMEKPANHSGDVALGRMVLVRVAAVKTSTSNGARAVTVVSGAGHVVELTDGTHYATRFVLLHGC